MSACLPSLRRAIETSAVRIAAVSDVVCQGQPNVRGVALPYVLGERRGASDCGTQLIAECPAAQATAVSSSACTRLCSVRGLALRQNGRAVFEQMRGAIKRRSSLSQVPTGCFRSLRLPACTVWSWLRLVCVWPIGVVRFV